MAKSRKVIDPVEGQAKMSTPALDLNAANAVVKYFENMKKANEEILKMIEFNLKQAREQARAMEARLEKDENQVEMFNEKAS